MDAVAHRVIAHTTTEPLALRVADLDRSRRFYTDVFGLVARPDNGDWILSPPPAGQLQRSIRLTTSAAAPSLRGLALELETLAQVLDLYMVARLAGHAAQGLRWRNGSLVALFRDPDGHIIELSAPEPAMIASPAHRPGDDARRPARDRAAAAHAVETHTHAMDPAGVGAGPTGRDARAAWAQPSRHPLGAAHRLDPEAVGERRTRVAAFREAGEEMWRRAPDAHGRAAHPRRRGRADADRRSSSRSAAGSDDPRAIAGPAAAGRW